MKEIIKFFFVLYCSVDPDEKKFPIEREIVDLIENKSYLQ